MVAGDRPWAAGNGHVNNQRVLATTVKRKTTIEEGHRLLAVDLSEPRSIVKSSVVSGGSGVVVVVVGHSFVHPCCCVTDSTLPSRHSSRYLVCWPGPQALSSETRQEPQVSHEPVLHPSKADVVVVVVIGPFPFFCFLSFAGFSFSVRVSQDSSKLGLGELATWRGESETAPSSRASACKSASASRTACWTSAANLSNLSWRRISLRMPKSSNNSSLVSSRRRLRCRPRAPSETAETP
mmetsp:Transcript_99478/g.195400  ORF Transcript_99478/g.195400 Transcript_99478/m.195400 type:complete len:238 (+) Transcript_99478:17-730(+)